MLVIKNGRVIDPATNTDAPRDILIDGDKIAEVAQPGSLRAVPGAEVFDAAGLIVAPGFIDLHAHLREPGQESSETIETGTRAAARGGFTAVCCMPNTRPVNDNASVTRFILDRAKATGSVRVWPIGAASVGSKGEAISEIAGMKEAGIVAVSDDGKPIATAKLARQVMDYCRSFDLPVIEHAEDVSLAGGAVMREGVASLRLGLRGMPAAAEAVCVARDVELAELTGARLHIAHLSSKASLEQVRRAKSRGLRVTCEVTPHHFTLIDEDVSYDSRFKMNPPLAAREDRAALLEGLADGTVDAIATDHAPHEPALKDGRGVRPRALRDLGIRNGARARARATGAPGAAFARAHGRAGYAGPSRDSGQGAQDCCGPAGGFDDFFPRSRMDLPGGALAEQIAKFAVRREEV